MAEEDGSVVVVVESVEVTETTEEVIETTTTIPISASSDLKRKLDELEDEPNQNGSGDLVVKNSSTSQPADDDDEEELNVNKSIDEAPDAKRARLDDEQQNKEDESDASALENGHEEQKVDVQAVENVETADVKSENPQMTLDGETEGAKHVTVESKQIENAENKSADAPQEGDAQNSSDETLKMEDAQHPSEGDLQHPTEGIPQEGDPKSQQESVPESQMMSRKMEVPNNKVGVLIGKAGDTIRLLQHNSGAKIQITRDAEADPYAATRPVELIGALENINKAEKLIKDVIAEADAGGSPSLVARGFGTVQASVAAEQIEIQVPNEKVGLIIGRGGETIKNLQTRSGARIQLIPQHLPDGDRSLERTVRVTGDKRQIEVAREMIKEVMNQPVKPSPLSGGYNQQAYRARGPGGPPQWGSRTHSASQATIYDNQQRGMYPSHNQYMPPAYGGYPSQQTAPRNNFNAGWDQRSGSMQTPQSGGYDYYGHGGHGSDSSAPNPMPNSGHVPASAHGAPPTHPGYGQQPYSKPPTYGMPSQGPAPQSYGPPRASQPGDVPYQNPVSSAHSYGQTLPSQQPYPYAASGPTQQAYPYGSAPPANDGYSQPPTHSTPAPVYPQPGGQPVSGYGQPGGQPAPGYAQGGQPGSYGPYSSQPGYDQSAPNNANYYQGPTDTGYSNAPTSAYGAPPSAQAGYVQPASNQPAYEQPAAQSGGYPSVPGSAPGFVKTLSPQPVYGQYDSTQMYGGAH
ncbi:hypothetical protein IFM89_037019 [Coptis chinensis]|uniref:K Homology domain-containing protein n=1 Tax=Coptis chinensis TaxID=261450 RepID=A0A835HUL1_9MAGN|nr:hypothetical protein IFM89_037019 [Coptis chinensis]